MWYRFPLISKAERCYDGRKRLGLMQDAAADAAQPRYTFMSLTSLVMIREKHIQSEVKVEIQDCGAGSFKVRRIPALPRAEGSTRHLNEALSFT